MPDATPNNARDDRNIWFTLRCSCAGRVLSTRNVLRTVTEFWVSRFPLVCQAPHGSASTSGTNVSRGPPLCRNQVASRADLAGLFQRGGPDHSEACAPRPNVTVDRFSTTQEGDEARRRGEGQTSAGRRFMVVNHALPCHTRHVPPLEPLIQGDPTGLHRH